MDLESERICIIGQGYVGLTLTAVVAQSGYDVLGVERDREKLDSLQEGTTHFDEPGLETTIRTQMNLGSLEFERVLTADNTADCAAYIVAVGSPLDSDGSGADLSMLQSAVENIAEHLDSGDTVIIRSTISVGTARRMANVLEERSDFVAGEDFYVAQAPERTVQGAALEEIRSLPQIIGGYNERSVDEAESIFNEIAETLIKVGPLEAAELIKLFDNTYRDINVAIGNAFGEIAAAHGLNGHRLIKLANAGYERNQIKKPGAGVGGGCLPKDPYILVESVTNGSSVVDLGEELILTARDINESMPDVTGDLIAEIIKKTGRTKGEVTSLVLGAAFKGQPATNDIRNTPAAPIIESLNEFGRVATYDPHVEDEKIELLGATPVDTGDRGLKSLFDDRTYDLLVIANDNPIFKDLDLSYAYKRMADDPVIVDGWGLYDHKTVHRIGFEYRVVGGSGGDF